MEPDTLSPPCQRAVRFSLSSLTLCCACFLSLSCTDPSNTADDSAIPKGTEVITTDGEMLGRVDFPTSCDISVQGDLELGLALLHHMNYGKAKPVFEAAAEADPACAIAYWGIAMTYVHPLWPDTVAGENFVAGAELVGRAAAAAHTSEREAAYVAALAAYFDDEERTEWERLAASLEGWEEAHADNPADDEAAVFHALLLLGNAPAEDKTYARQKEAAEILDGVLRRIPKHPGAHHYAIHAHDFPPLANDALDIARRYDDLAPENTHALHMTSHIFTRLGLWPESIEFNIRAAAASSERTTAGAISLHHMHALDYLAYAYLQIADDQAANEVLEAMKAMEPPFQNHAATAYAFAAVPARIALERHNWEQAANIQPRWPDGVPWPEYPHFEALSQFAIALGNARSGNFDQARIAIAELEQLEKSAAELDIAYDWPLQVRIQRIAATSWLAYELGDIDGALEMALQAAEMEGSTEKNPVTPGEVLPARELYGDMLLLVGRHTEALAAYSAVLERSPNRFNSLYGAGKAAESAGDAVVARGFYEKLLESCADPGKEHTELAHARNFLDGVAATEIS